MGTPAVEQRLVTVDEIRSTRERLAGSTRLTPQGPGIVPIRL
jgi:hypothetical protein